METKILDDLEQVGGWYNVQIVPISELIYCPHILTNENAAETVIAETTTGIDIMPVTEHIKITETPKKNKSGTIHTIKAEFELRVQLTEIDNYFNRFRNNKVIFIGTKHYGQEKLYGSKLFPLDFSYQFINGQKQEDGSLTRIRITGKTPQKPVFINR
ncbi:hypothetical protein [Tenacibaculum dicentrarchi]|uniref:hypothetical protein n=1 Tax=Tenacibaculum dicentrarchi TaxID=669041 RepID=UPI000C654B2A|nr:conserved hypothetical protein. Putative prophage protein [Tenacibaculum dicentrarchi]